MHNSFTLSISGSVPYRNKLSRYSLDRYENVCVHTYSGTVPERYRSTCPHLDRNRVAPHVHVRSQRITMDDTCGRMLALARFLLFAQSVKTLSVEKHTNYIEHVIEYNSRRRQLKRSRERRRRLALFKQVQIRRRRIFIILLLVFLSETKTINRCV